jgi:hypothetical protein
MEVARTNFCFKISVIGELYLGKSKLPADVLRQFEDGLFADSVRFPDRNTHSFEELEDLPLSESVLVGSEDKSCEFILTLSSGSQKLLKHVQIAFQNQDCLSFVGKMQLRTYCSIYRLFKLSKDCCRVSQGVLLLLQHGGYNNFHASQFNHLCEGHSNTPTMILDTDEFALENLKEVLDNSFRFSMLSMHCHWFCA